MSYELILVSTEGSVGLIQFNRPKALNALNTQLMREVVTALRAFDEDDSIGCTVLYGNDQAFAAGADIKEMADKGAIEMAALDNLAVWDGLSSISKPVIAAVSGFCLGGGCEVAMMCDMIIASETAKFGQPEINIGVMPGAGGTQRLTRVVGKALAMEMVLTGRMLTAQELKAHGLINRVVPVESYLVEAKKLAQEIASKPPVAVRMAKQAILKSYQTTLSEGLAFERQSFYMLFASEDQREGMAAFVEKRKPTWQGR